MNFDKYIGDVTIRLMPVWEWSEIEFWRKYNYNDVVPRKLAKKLFSSWGGIPRFVLQRANKVEHQAMLDVAIKKCKIDIFDFVDKGKDQSFLSHELVHIHTNLLTDYYAKLPNLHNVSYYNDSTFNQIQLDTFNSPYLKQDKYQIW
jgi:hypothetical protein